MYNKSHSDEYKQKMSQRMKGNKIWLGKKHSDEHKQYMSQLQQGEHNGMWKGDNAGYAALHLWVNIHLQKPDKCIKCGKNNKLEACNISGKYKRDLSDWEYLCRSCHAISDGRYRNLKREFEGV